MFKDTPGFSGFSVDDLQKAKEFYGTILGIDLEELPNMGLRLHMFGGIPIFIYPKPNHEPAAYTIFNFQVKNIDETVDNLIAKGITLEQYNYPEMKTDLKGIVRYEGRSMAWFKDPAGNILSVLSEVNK